MAGAWGSCGLVDRSWAGFPNSGDGVLGQSVASCVKARSGHWTSLSSVSQYAKCEAKGELTGVLPKDTHAAALPE